MLIGVSLTLWLQMRALRFTLGGGPRINSQDARFGSDLTWWVVRLIIAAVLYLLTH
jgi:hypothetical protein